MLGASRRIFKIIRIDFVRHHRPVFPFSPTVATVNYIDSTSLLSCAERKKSKEEMKTTVVTIPIIVVLMAVLTTELLGHPTPDQRSQHHNHRHQHTDPNSGRASRLLYSPRSRSLSNNNVPDMHTALRRYTICSRWRGNARNLLNDGQNRYLVNKILGFFLCRLCV